MQPNETGNITRRALDVEDYIDILRRHKAWIFGPVFAALVIAVVVAFVYPDTFISTAVIRVVPPQVPENFVPSNINVDIQGRVNSMTQVILSRTTLLNVINTYGLYPKERARMPLDDVVEAMKLKDIRIGPVQQPLNSADARQRYPAFQISFGYDNRFTAQKVTTDLVSRLLVENDREINQQTTGTTDFLHDQWLAAKKKLDEVEQKLSAFRARNLGKLPEEQPANYQQLSAMQLQTLNLQAAMSRVNEDKLMLENQLRTLKDEQSAIKDPGSPEQLAIEKKDEKLADKDHQIEQMESQLEALREHYKDTYPDVQAAVTRLANAKKEREALAKEQANKKPEAAPVVRPLNPLLAKETRDLDAAAKRTQSEIAAKDLEMAELQKESNQLSATIKNYQGRVEGIPVGLKEYDELLRDRDLAKRDYEDLDSRLNKSEMSTKLENRQQGERLEQLDPPSLPETPALPNRPLIIAVGTAFGLILGLFLAGAREVKDSSLKNLKDVRVYTQLPILGSIPLLENDLVVRRRRRLAWLAWSTACLVGVTIMSSSVVYYYATKM